MAAKYPPYVNGYGHISKLFKAIKDASVPTKFTNNFMVTALGLKSSSFRAMIPLLKRLGFIDQANVPTKSYKDFRDGGLSGAVMAERLRAAYSELFNANEFAHKLKKQDLLEKLKTLTGTGAEDKNIAKVASTFLELCKLAVFDGEANKLSTKQDQEPPEDTKDQADDQENQKDHRGANLGISYTINLNLPATTEIQVFNAIFKSLKEHILHVR